jgi:cytochrome c-type biogenesis protein
MNAWINQVLSNEHATLTALAAVFLLGMISVVTCGCNFAVLGVVAGYTGASASPSKTRIVVWRGLMFLLGGIISMAVIGALFGYAGNLVSQSLGNYWKIAAGLLAIFFGLFSMDLLPFRMPGISINKARFGDNLFTAMLFGLAIGGLSTALNTCCNPIFPVILAASFLKGSTLWGFFMLSVFAFGYGLPLAVVIIGGGLGLGKLSKSLSVVGTVVKYIGGIALILLGFYFLFTF